MLTFTEIVDPPAKLDVKLNVALLEEGVQEELLILLMQELALKVNSGGKTILIKLPLTKLFAILKVRIYFVWALIKKDCGLAVALDIKPVLQLKDAVIRSIKYSLLLIFTDEVNVNVNFLVLGGLVIVKLPTAIFEDGAEKIVGAKVTHKSVVLEEISVNVVDTLKNDKDTWVGILILRNPPWGIVFVFLKLILMFGVVPDIARLLTENEVIVKTFGAVATVE